MAAYLGVLTERPGEEPACRLVRIPAGARVSPSGPSVGPAAYRS
jgi:hypothetical protein